MPGERREERHRLIIATRVSARMRQVFESIVDAVSGSNWSYLIVFAIAMLDAFFPDRAERGDRDRGRRRRRSGRPPRRARDPRRRARGDRRRQHLASRSATSSAPASSGASSRARRHRNGCTGRSDARGARRLHDRRRALHPRRPHGDDLHGRLRRDAIPGAASSARRDRGRDLGHLHACCSATIGGKSFEEEPWKGLLLAFAFALAVTVVVEVVRHLRHRRRAKRV